MLISGLAALKQKYLGSTFPGQDLCYCKISIGENAVHIARIKAGVLVGERWIDDTDQLFSLKEKLRAYVRRQAAPKRWIVHRTRHGAEMVVYYPSVSWFGRTGSVRWFSDGSF
jgi:hypothetical protein